MQNYEMEILVNGSPVKEYLHEGKIFIEGRKGTEFSLRIKNNTAEKVLAVPSVDGLSVMDGKPASFESGGYIIGGYSSVTVRGWRTSDKDVAAFIFETPDKSYSERSGEGKVNLGIIGLAVFHEKKPELPPTPIVIHNCDCGHVHPTSPLRPYWQDTVNNDGIPFFGSVQCSNTGGSEASLGGASLNMMQSSFDAPRKKSLLRSAGLGTGWGDIKDSEVIREKFDRVPLPVHTMDVFYDSRKNLEAMGIEFTPVVRATPQSFPGNFCQPPKK